MLTLKRNDKNRFPQVSTASLPDIIFILLFFFMVVTVMRSKPLKLEITKPNIQDPQNAKDRKLMAYIYVGATNKSSKDYKIQIDDAFAKIEDIRPFVDRQKEKLPIELKERFTISLRIDKAVEMGIVEDIKVALRKSKQQRIIYSANPKLEN